MRFTKLATTGAVAAALGMAGIGLASTASAAPQSDVCGANRVCIYKHNNFYVKIGERAPGGGVVNVPLSVNDEMSSWRNQTSTNAAWYHDQGGKGRCVTLASSDKDGDINSYDDNKLSSWKTNGGC